jgi:hypothetical protein
MEDGKRVRVVKRKESGQTSGPGRAATPSPVRDGSREARDVVSSWVRDHARRAEEFRRGYSTLLKELGFAPPLSCRTQS